MPECLQSLSELCRASQTTPWWDHPSPARWEQLPRTGTFLPLWELTCPLKRWWTSQNLVELVLRWDQPGCRSTCPTLCTNPPTLAFISHLFKTPRFLLALARQSLSLLLRPPGRAMPKTLFAALHHCSCPWLACGDEWPSLVYWEHCSQGFHPETPVTKWWGRYSYLPSKESALVREYFTYSCLIWKNNSNNCTKWLCHMDK